MVRRHPGILDSMPHHVFTRRALYDRVWAEPISRVARSLGVSDVGLAKACRVAGIPLPPRGSWSGHRDNRPHAMRPPLPARPDRPDRVVIAPAARRAMPSLAVQAMAAEVAKAVRAATPNDPGEIHPIVRQWLADDGERNRGVDHSHPERHTQDEQAKALAHRRLALINALLGALEARDLRVGSCKDGIKVRRDGYALTFTVYERSRIEPRPATSSELRGDPNRRHVRALVPAGDLVMKIRAPLSLPTAFYDRKVPLEGQMAEMVASLEAGLAELAERSHLQRQAETRWREAQALRAQQAAEREVAEGGRQRLLAQAARYREASEIRALIAATDVSVRATRPAYRAWRAWALKEADALDPLLNTSSPAPAAIPG